MVLTILVLFVFVLPTLAQSNDGGHISIVVSKTGLEFAKDFLINKVISTTIPLQLPDIENKVKIPLIGRVRMGLSNIQIDAVDVQSSKIETGKDGIVLSVSGATANLSMDWSYTYRASFFKISDHGDASVKVKFWKSYVLLKWVFGLCSEIIKNQIGLVLCVHLILSSSDIVSLEEEKT